MKEPNGSRYPGNGWNAPTSDFDDRWYIFDEGAEGVG